MATVMVMTVTDVGRSKVFDRPVNRPTVDRGSTDGLTALWPTVDRGLTDSLTVFEPKFTEKTFFGKILPKTFYRLKNFTKKRFFGKFRFKNRSNRRSNRGQSSVKPSVRPRSRLRLWPRSVGQRSLTDRDRPITDHDRPLPSLVLSNFILCDDKSCNGDFTIVLTSVLVKSTKSLENSKVFTLFFFIFCFFVINII